MPEDGTPHSTQAIILAAGKGTRMKSNLPKILHPLRGKTMIEHALAATAVLSDRPTVVVVSSDADTVRGTLSGRAQFAEQAEQLGTGHAVMQAEPLAKDANDIVVTYADLPLVRAETYTQLVQKRRKTGAAIVLATLITDNTRGFGRIVRESSGDVRAIVEEVACTPEQRNIKEVNIGVYCFDGAWLWSALRRIQPNLTNGEYFLTDLVESALSEGRVVQAIAFDDADEFIGINTRVDLADADAALRRRINRAHMMNGVTLVDPSSTYIDCDVKIDTDVTILPNTHLQGNTTIGAESVIGPNSILSNAIIGRRVRFQQSVILDSRVDDDAEIGPFSRLRPGSHVCERAHMGNFAELKNSTLGAGSHMGHFSYAGDATIGEHVNIGAGAITCNYDGEKKSRTVIGDNAFIGSDTMLVAPVTIGKNARTGAGAVVTKDVPPDTLAVGAPARVIRQLKVKS
jgi:bifunctional UDP-N-acetylglucosamine pyrophosphorylase/glucosamine-1-phosphate N-acetyltransferase